MNHQAKWTGVFLSVLSGFLIAANVTPAQARDQFNNNAIQFDVDTVVEFEFLESNGVYQSTFGVINTNTGERTPLIVEIKPSDLTQPVNVPSDFTNDTPLDDRDDFLGTPGNTVPEPLAEFEFQANTPYAFYLESFYNGQSAGVVYSTSLQNSGGTTRIMFDGDVPALATGGVLLQWDDTGSLLVQPAQEDRDFDDFVVRAGGHLDCPPSSNP
jgi:hypothetical protein